ncbi:hypothetical protein HBI26_197700 [Parastagonospora nodorum]|nr:hypothetical protein HBI10_109400 [Parastagonospora nodorum]KAH4022227.1 hypothetical protein HBI13_099780 [Parastagonospora nodorum]KAH4612435.1 hypothetical protein HBH82_032020 [Parastagonospora nodorum]KAH4703003.1 hypothetical protein HBH67_123650 [Parastagonospora nodorum]KAH4706200.1 hypothetical protein HBH78_053720 [Parastagonospora nodorum]
MSDNTDGPPRKKVRRAMEDGPELRSRPVLILVGDIQEEYHIHENILRGSSSFFDNALKKEWKEGQDRAIDLPEVNNEAFSIWIKWLYTGSVFLTRPEDHSSDGKSSKECPRWDNCYALGDFLQDTDFKDACIDVMIEIMVSLRRHPYDLPAMIYKCSTQDSNHRTFVVDTFINVMKRKDWAKNASHPQQFLFDVIKVLSVNPESGIEGKTCSKFFNLDDTCKYHDHGPDKPCYKTKPAFRF